MNKIEKKNYQQKRENILEKAKGRTKDHSKQKSPEILNVIPLFKTKTQEEPNKNSNSRINNRNFPWMILFLGILVAMMGYFLVKETTEYYFSIDGNRPEAILKALILEGIVVAFTVMKTRTGALRLSYKIMIGMIYLYTLWALGGSVVQAAIQNESQLKLNQKVNQELELEISKKEALRDNYFRTDRITLARKYDRNLDELKQKLDQARKIKIKIPSLFVVWNQLATLLIFRGLVMFGNLLCVRELCRWYRVQIRRAEV